MKNSLRKQLRAKHAQELFQWQKLNGPLDNECLRSVLSHYADYTDPQGKAMPVGGEGHTTVARTTERVSVIKQAGIMNFITRVERAVVAVATYEVPATEREFDASKVAIVSKPKAEWGSIRNG